MGRSIGFFALAALLPLLASADDFGENTGQVPAVEAGKTAQVSLKGSKVLLVGDSHSTMAFGTTLDQRLKDAGAKTAVFAVSSSRPKSWIKHTVHGEGSDIHDYDGKRPDWLDTRKGVKRYCKAPGRKKHKIKEDGSCPDGEEQTDKPAVFITTPDFPKLVKKYTPALTIVALGTNLPTHKEFAEAILAAIKDLGSACVWVGPPYVPSNNDDKTDKVYKVLYGLVGKHSCLLIDSRPSAMSDLKYPKGKGDRTHFSGELAHLGKAWANHVADAIVKPAAGRSP